MENVHLIHIKQFCYTLQSFLYTGINKDFKIKFLGTFFLDSTLNVTPLQAQDRT
jgi:hypothetical protein